MIYIYIYIHSRYIHVVFEKNPNEVSIKSISMFVYLCHYLATFRAAPRAKGFGWVIGHGRWNLVLSGGFRVHCFDMFIRKPHSNYRTCTVDFPFWGFLFQETSMWMAITFPGVETYLRWVIFLTQADVSCSIHVSPIGSRWVHFISGTQK